MLESSRHARPPARLDRGARILLLMGAILAAPAAWAQPVDSLLLHLEFEGDLLDSSGNMHDGVGAGTLAYTAGVLGMAASFSGDDSVTVPSVPDAAFSTTAFSVTFWFDTPINDKASFVGKRTTCSISPFFDVRSNPGTIDSAISDAAGNHVLSAPRAAGWRFFAAVRETGLIRLFIDGVLQGHASVPAIDIENATPVGISTSPCIGVDGTQMLAGELDDLRVYSRALTTGEVASFVPGLIFGDGFESGGLTAWSSFTP